jgi:hypothetical protein
MIRQPVVSSDLRAVGYDAARRILEVEFHSGGIYQYFGVPSSVYSGLLQAGSKGRYLHTFIKGRYTYQKVG